MVVESLIYHAVDQSRGVYQVFVDLLVAVGLDLLDIPSIGEHVQEGELLGGLQHKVGENPIVLSQNMLHHVVLSVLLHRASQLVQTAEPVEHVGA